MRELLNYRILGSHHWKWQGRDKTESGRDTESLSGKLGKRALRPNRGEGVSHMKMAEEHFRQRKTSAKALRQNSMAEADSGDCVQKSGRIQALGVQGF